MTWGLPHEADVVVVGVLVADGDEVGPQALRQLVAGRSFSDRIHRDAGAGRRLEQEAGLAVPGQLADRRAAAARGGQPAR